eukprot:TRINITY_DN9845_c0_g1_i1.p1 TRINITY_DN9845_c0_g1~~TRINITY_DN9845_c0_g1_i1.p1  ORF type:complete len:297 (+),score=105.17 TRINITY_DN9845_c0_g1_i1:47-937(+)
MNDDYSFLNEYEKEIIREECREYYDQCKIQFTNEGHSGGSYKFDDIFREHVKTTLDEDWQLVFDAFFKIGRSTRQITNRLTPVVQGDLITRPRTPRCKTKSTIEIRSEVLNIRNDDLVYDENNWNEDNSDFSNFNLDKPKNDQIDSSEPETIEITDDIITNTSNLSTATPFNESADLPEEIENPEIFDEIVIPSKIDDRTQLEKEIKEFPVFDVKTENVELVDDSKEVNNVKNVINFKKSKFSSDTIKSIANNLNFEEEKKEERNEEVLVKFKDEPKINLKKNFGSKFDFSAGSYE